MISIKITHLRGEIDMNGYIDFNLIKKYPNKYNLTPSNIEKLKILNWEELKKYLRHKIVLKDGVWWEHFEGCNFDNDKYDDYSQFRIAFNEKSNKIICGFTTYFGCKDYIFNEFYKIKDIEQECDLYVQINTIKYLNMLLDKGILGFDDPKSEIVDEKQEVVIVPSLTRFTGDFYDIDYSTYKNIILDSIRISTIDKNNKTELIPFDIKIGGKGGCRIVPSLRADEYLMSYQRVTMGYKLKLDKDNTNAYTGHKLFIDNTLRYGEIELR